MSVKKIILLCLSLFLFSNYAFANNFYYVANFDDDASVEEFVNQFKQAVINNDKNKVASMIHYPIEATFKDKPVIINNKDEFLKFYDDIFDENLCNIIANANTHNMFVNYKGVMLDNGEVWFSNDKDGIKVIAVGVCRSYDPDIK